MEFKKIKTEMFFEGDNPTVHEALTEQANREFYSLIKQLTKYENLSEDEQNLAQLFFVTGYSRACILALGFTEQ